MKKYQKKMIILSELFDLPRSSLPSQRLQAGIRRG